MINDKCIVIPAAGASTRLERPKQLVEFEGKTLIRRSVDIALEALPNVIVVTGCEDVAVRRELEGVPVIVVDNPDWEKGMGKTIAVGVQAAIDRFRGIEAVLIHLCDLPTIGSDHLRNLLDYQDRTKADLIYTRYKDTKGVPAVFGRRFFEELTFLDGDRGAKHLIDRLDDARKDYVDFGGKFVDLDTPEDIGEFG